MKIFFALVIAIADAQIRRFLPRSMRKRTTSELVLTVYAWGLGISSANLVTDGSYVLGVLHAITALVIARLLENLDAKR